MGRGVAACLLLPLLGACGSDTVKVESADLGTADEAACRALVKALPDELSGEPRRPIDPADAPGAAWGDPAYVLTCGVPKPSDYSRDATCNDLGGVGWFVPEEQLSDLRGDVIATALTLTPYAELQVPARYRTNGIDSALAELAPILRANLKAGEPCQ